MRSPFGPDGVSLNRQSKGSAPGLLLLLALFFFVLPLFLQRHNPPAAPQPTVAVAANFTGPQQSPQDVQAQQAWREPETEASWAPSRDFTGRLSSMAGITLAVSLLIVVTLNLFKKQLGGLNGVGPAGARPLMKVVARQGLTQGVQLCVVQVGPKNLVLSVAEGGNVQTVCELTADEIAAATAPDPNAAPALPVVRPTAGQVYGQIFKQYFGVIPGFGAPKR